MAIRTDASTEGLRRTASLPSSTAFTMAAWFMPRGAGDGTWESILGLLSSGGSDWQILYKRVSGDTDVYIHGSSGDGQLISGATPITLANDTWYYAAMGCNGTGSSALTGWIITTAGTVYTLSVSGVTYTPAEMIALRSNSFGEWVNGRLANLMVWSTKLTQAELIQQMWSARPIVQEANLHLWSPLWGAADLNDYSGNARTWTSQGGTLTDEDHPPVTYGAPITWVIGQATGGGTTYNQSADGTLTNSGAIFRSTGKVPVGTLTSAGALIRTGQKLLGGTLTNSGAISRLTSKLFSGTLTSAGALETVRTILKALEGTLTSAGDLIRQGQKTLTGTLTSDGSLSRLTSKLFSGTLTNAGALETVRTFVKALEGTLTSAGTLIRQGQKALTGTLTSDGVLSRLMSKLFSGTLTSAGTLGIVRTFLKILEGTLTSAGSLVKQGQKALAGVLTSGGGIIRSIMKLLTGSITSTGTLSSEGGTVSPPSKSRFFMKYIRGHGKQDKYRSIR